MAAEAPDGHSGGLGRVEEVRHALSGADTVGHKGSNKEEMLDCFTLNIRRRYKDYNYFNKHSHNCPSYAIESNCKVFALRAVTR